MRQQPKFHAVKGLPELSRQNLAVFIQMDHFNDPAILILHWMVAYNAILFCSRYAKYKLYYIDINQYVS